MPAGTQEPAQGTTPVLKPIVAAAEVLKEIVRQYPAARPLFGLLGIVAVVTTTGVVFLYDWRVAFVAIMICVVFAAIIVAFAALTKLGPQALLRPALVIMWAAVALFVASLVCLFSSVFFHVPLDLSTWLTGSAASPPIIPSEAEEAKRDYLELIDAFNKNDKERYYDGFAAPLDCFYDAPNIDIRDKRPELTGELSVRPQDIEFIRMDSPSRVVLCDRGHFDRLQGVGRRLHNKAIVMQREDDRWRVIIETVRLQSKCYASPC